MNFKKKFILCFIITFISFLTIVNIKNPNKTKFYLFVSKTEEISVGNLITFSFISGYIFSSLLRLISIDNQIFSSDDSFKNDDRIKSNIDTNLTADQEFNFYKEDNYEKGSISNRPPERDIRESQPTISVNYRFVETDNDINASKKPNTNNFNIENDTNDWSDIKNDW